MFISFRTVMGTLGRAGLYVIMMTKGVRFEFCSVVVVSKFLDVGWHVTG